MSLLSGVATGVSNWIRGGIGSEDNPVARTGTEEKSHFIQDIAKQALMTVGKIAVMAVMSELGLNPVAGLGVNYLISKAEDTLVKSAVSVLGKSANPLAHAGIRIAERVISGIGQTLRQ